jgi:cyanophycinase
VSARVRGTLVVIGGHEDRSSDGERVILREVARRAARRAGALLIVTVATDRPGETAELYRRLFHGLGVERVQHLRIESREDAQDAAAVRRVEEAGLLFFTGGDQLRITSQVGDSPVYQCMMARYREGLTIAGTSAGAAAMPETMIVAGPGDASADQSDLGMAPGLGLVDSVVVDSHFAERGRIGRLVVAVAQNPKNLGLGIDEDTAVVLADGGFRVIGSGAVSVVDGAGIDYSSLSERRRGVTNVFGVRLHVLAAGAAFDLERRRPSLTPQHADAAS